MSLGDIVNPDNLDSPLPGLCGTLNLYRFPNRFWVMHKNTILEEGEPATMYEPEEPMYEDSEEPEIASDSKASSQPQTPTPAQAQAQAQPLKDHDKHIAVAFAPSSYRGPDGNTLSQLFVTQSPGTTATMNYRKDPLFENGLKLAAIMGVSWIAWFFGPKLSRH
ncbi:hypothetical protein GGR58DRAFT_507659 [Xylaria digitata]|nr:hypothetical protein GGR58DRAFT_507659 [Xylaria digitata]